MGAHIVFCRRTALRGSDDGVVGVVQAIGAEQCRDHILHLMALSAMGHQAVVEPVCGHYPHQAVVGNHDAAAHWCGFRRCGLHHPHIVLAARHTVLLLADGLRQRHSRHCRRRILYAGPRRTRPGMVCGNKEYVLSHCHHLRPRAAGGIGGQPSGALPL